MIKANFALMKRLLSMIECQGKNYNIHAEALSAVQKAKSRSTWVDFDIDDKNVPLVETIREILPQGSYKILETRGGFHLLVNPKKASDVSNMPNVPKMWGKDWYRIIQKAYGDYVDQTGDNMIPIPGTYQGGFTPKFIEI